MQSCYSAGMKRCGICMEEKSPLWVRRSKSEETLCRLLITMVEETFDIRRSWVDHERPVMNLKSGYVEGENCGRDFWYKKVLSRPRKAGNESEERICWGREFQMEGEAKENDLRPICDRISGTNKKILVGRFKRSWRNVWCNQIINVCWFSLVLEYTVSKSNQTSVYCTGARKAKNIQINAVQTTPIIISDIFV